MSARLEPKAVEVFLAAAATGDKSIDIYLDVERLNVVKVKDGRCVPEDLDADEVERDEARFAEIPVVTLIDEYLWMEDFVEEQGDARIAGFLDGRAGANARFLKQLSKQAPEGLAAWEAYRTRRVAGMVDEWFVELGVET